MRGVERIEPGTFHEKLRLVEGGGIEDPGRCEGGYSKSEGSCLLTYVRFFFLSGFKGILTIICSYLNR